MTGNMSKVPAVVTLDVIYATLLENGEQIQRAIEKLEGELNRLDDHERRIHALEERLARIPGWQAVAGVLVLLAAFYAANRWF